MTTKQQLQDLGQQDDKELQMVNITIFNFLEAKNDRCSCYLTGQATRPQENSHIMKIPTKTGSHQGAQPINKSDRDMSGGFNNQKSVDYVDIFDPDETRNLGYATTQKPSKRPQKQVWPPPFPDLATTDPNADYVFEYEDGETVTLAPENVQVEKRKKSRCGSNDFMCDKRSCVAKNFVCDGVRVSRNIIEFFCKLLKEHNKVSQTNLEQFRSYVRIK